MTSQENINITQEDFSYLMPFLEQKTTGKEALFNGLYVLGNGPDISDILNITPNPLSILLKGLKSSYEDYQYTAIEKTETILTHLMAYCEDDFQKIIFEMKAKLTKQLHLTSVGLHQWHDEHAILADNQDPFIPVFNPNKIINCKGISEICNDEERKKLFLAQTNQHLSLLTPARAAYMQEYSDARKITKQDCQKDGLSEVMIDQYGLFATRDLPEHFLLGFYTGAYFDTLQTIDQYMSKMAEGCEAYLFGYEYQYIPMTSAYRTGNRLSLINSASDYSGSANDVARKLFYQQNTLPMCLKIDNNPNMMIKQNPCAFDLTAYVTIRPVKKGEQLFVDYGYDYWRNKSQDFTKGSKGDIDEAYLILKKEDPLRYNVRDN